MNGKRRPEERRANLQPPRTIQQRRDADPRVASGRYHGWTVDQVLAAGDENWLRWYVMRHPAGPLRRAAKRVLDELDNGCRLPIETVADDASFELAETLLEQARRARRAA
jgi:hypothetical protein